VSLWAISVDSAEQSKALAEKIAADQKGKVTFSLLSDPQHQVIDRYGLRDPRYEEQKLEGIPYAAVYVIDKTGKVAWARVENDYKQRPTNVEIRKAVDALR
jgi:peroxiredoxin